MPELPQNGILLVSAAEQKALPFFNFSSEAQTLFGIQIINVNCLSGFFLILVLVPWHFSIEKGGKNNLLETWYGAFYPNRV